MAKSYYAIIASIATIIVAICLIYLTAQHNIECQKLCMVDLSAYYADGRYRLYDVGCGCDMKFVVENGTIRIYN